MSQLKKDIEFLRTVLPVDYEIRLSNVTAHYISKMGFPMHCISTIGWHFAGFESATSEIRWRVAVAEMKEHFGARWMRFTEIKEGDNHREFIIYLK